MKDILVIAETFQGRLMPVSFELAGAALKIACFIARKEYAGNNISESFEQFFNKDKINDYKQQELINNNEFRNFFKKLLRHIKIVVPAANPVPLAEQIEEYTSMDVIALNMPGIDVYDSDIYIACLSRLIDKMDVSHVLIAHTSQGRDFAPGLSLKLNASFISGVNSISCYDKDIVDKRFSDLSITGSALDFFSTLIYSRSVFNNTMNMNLCPVQGHPIVMTIVPGRFKFPYKIQGEINISRIGNGMRKAKPKLSMEEIFLDHISDNQNFSRIVHGDVLRKGSDNQDLREAKVIVAVGRGIGDRDKLDMIFRFAESFPSSAVGASRPIVDMGWLGYEHQIGITGAKVSPELYIACGISGSSQHLAGMEDSGIIVSINNNSNAPIFRYSDICIKADLIEFINAFLEHKINY